MLTGLGFNNWFRVDLSRLNSDWNLQHADTRTHSRFNPCCCCWCCYGLLRCWSDPSPDTHTQHNISNTILTAYTLSLSSIPSSLFYLSFILYWDILYRFTHTHTCLYLSCRLYPMRNEKCTLLLLYHTTVLLNYSLSSYIYVFAICLNYVIIVVIYIIEYNTEKPIWIFFVFSLRCFCLRL